MSDEKPMGQVIQIDEARIRDHLGEMVRGTRDAAGCRSRPALRCRPLRQRAAMDRSRSQGEGGFYWVPP